MAPTTALELPAYQLKDQASLDPLMEAIGEARYVLLGEASHGTHEYYRWRAELSKRLITEKGFSFVAVEGDWPDCYRVNRYVKHYPRSGDNAEEVLRAYDRWPTWMWSNHEVVEFAEWLRRHNADVPLKRRAGFYGLDVYSLWDSLRTVLDYLQQHDETTAEAARKAFACFEPFGPDFSTYGWSHLSGYKNCERELMQALSELRRTLPKHEKDGDEETFNLRQNAITAKKAEEYYRVMLRSDRSSWNLRDTHMNDTLERLMHFYGKNAKGIVWAHNTHVGDARYTDMVLDGTINIGQLVRQNHAGDTFLLGFASYHGTVIAGRQWDAPMERMPVPTARPGSLEHLLHEELGRNHLLLLRDLPRNHDLWQERDHRAIGVVYRPHAEAGNYVPTILPARYDAFVYLDKTSALHPLHMPERPDTDPPETFPSGV
jgi:erythromycin esterase